MPTKIYISRGRPRVLPNQLMLSKGTIRNLCKRTVLDDIYVHSIRRHLYYIESLFG